MNRPPEVFVTVREEDLLAFVQVCFEKAGLDAGHAALISRLLVNCDLRGVRSHGSSCANGYCRALEEGRYNPHPEYRWLSERQSVAVLSGGGTVGYQPMAMAAERAVAKARDTGLGMVTVRHIGHYGAAGHYSRMCMEAGCIGFSVQGYYNHGNARGAETPPQIGYFGNPPISFAIPGGEEADVVLDAATCILADYQRGPEYDALLEKIPAAFFKSMGYTAVASLMGGALAGISIDDETTSRWPQARYGGMVMAIDVESVVGIAALRREVDRMVRDLGDTYQPMPGTDRAQLPGAIEAQRMERYRRDGIPFGEREQSSITGLAERLGLAVPWS